MLSTLPFAVRVSYGGNTPCVEIRNGAEYILCDVGSGIRDFGNHCLKTGKSVGSDVFHIFISYVHWDHIQGFPFFTPAYLPGNKIHIYGFHDGFVKALAGKQNKPGFSVNLEGMQADINFHTLEPGQAYNIA
jgi:phosphoribosyl 1,2-cyclic phosphodiesterase